MEKVRKDRKSDHPSQKTINGAVFQYLLSNRFAGLYLESELLHQPAFPLMPDGEDVHPIMFRQVAIQCDIACSPLRNHQFTQISNWPTDQWVALQYFGCIYDLACRLGGNGWCFPCEEVEHALKIGEGALAEIDRWHV